jgi:protein-disulfide isomerase
MTVDARPDDRELTLAPLGEKVDHVRDSPAGRLIIEYGDAAFDRDRASTVVAERIRRDVDSGLASGQVLGTPTLFIDGIVHRGGYDSPALLAALAP